MTPIMTFGTGGEFTDTLPILVQDSCMSTTGCFSRRSLTSLTEKIDTTTPGGKLIFHLMGALAEFERDLIWERTNAGLAAARTRGRKGGRPKKLKTEGKVAMAQRMYADKANSVQDICSSLVSRAPYCTVM
jgi:hypothetical protein